MKRSLPSCHFSRFTFYLFILALSLFTFPLPVSTAIHNYQPRQRYCPEYFQKQQVKDFVLIYAYPRVTLLESWGTAACIVDNADLYGLPHEVVAAVIMIESRFNPYGINHMNCWGLMQVRPYDLAGNDVWLKELIEQGIITCVQDLLKPEKNIRAGCYILAKYLRQYGDLPTALSRYSGSTQPINTDYVSKVYDAMQYFEG